MFESADPRPAGENFPYVFKGTPAARQPSGPPGRIGRREREVIGEDA
jgi:hypothetical protein